MNFQDILLRAQAGDPEAINKILEMYKPLLLKQSIVFNVFDEDIYQELCMIVLRCIKSFEV